MKKLLLLFSFLNFTGNSFSQELKPISLLPPDKTRGVTIMKAFEARASVREWSSRNLSLQDISDLLWAANGINRSTEGKRTAPSAMNAQDVDIYLFNEEGIFLYDARGNKLKPVVAGDYRSLPGATEAPVNLVLVSDISRFRAGSDSLKIGWANMDTGIVSQNISLFCAGTGLKTRPRASFPGADKIRSLLKLNKTQYILLNHPVGYLRK
jgi:hypothetical protein